METNRRRDEGIHTIVNNCRYLVFSGGGAKGWAFLGVLDELDSQFPNFYKGIQGAAGSSVGALYATAVCCCANIAEIEQFSETLNSPFVFCPDLSTLLSKRGLDQGKYIKEQFRAFFRQKFGHDKITFQELHQRTQRTLVIYATNATTGRAIAFNHVLAPHTPVYKALFASACIPFIFTPQRIGDHYYVDAGMLVNFPWGSFPEEQSIGFRFESDYAKHQPTDSLTTGSEDPCKSSHLYSLSSSTTTAAHLTSNNKSPTDNERYSKPVFRAERHRAQKGEEESFQSLVQHFTQVMFIPMEHLEVMQLQKVKQPKRVVTLKVSACPCWKLSLNQDEIQELKEEGRDQVRKWITQQGPVNPIEFLTKYTSCALLCAAVLGFRVSSACRSSENTTMSSFPTPSDEPPILVRVCQSGGNQRPTRWRREKHNDSFLTQKAGKPFIKSKKYGLKEPSNLIPEDDGVCRSAAKRYTRSASRQRWGRKYGDCSWMKRKKCTLTTESRGTVGVDEEEKNRETDDYVG